MNAQSSSLPSRWRLRRAQHGALLIELLVSGLLALLTGAALFAVITSQAISDNTVRGQGTVSTAARQPMDSISDTIRNAQSVGSGNLSLALPAAAASSITCYTSSNGTTTTRIWLDASVSPAAVRRTRTEASGAQTTETILQSVSSLTFTYLKPGANYNADPAVWTTTANPNAPQATELGQIGAVRVRAQTIIDGYTRTLETLVRLRNSPYITAF